MPIAASMFRPLLAAALLAASAGAGHAGSGSSSSNHPTGNLKTSSGGTGMSKGGGDGGTGISPTANAPLNRLQSTFKPSHVTEPPPAGVRPHTDLAAAEKRTNLSSRDLSKRSTLYNKIAAAPHDPILVGASEPKLGPVKGGASDFRQAPGFTAEESKGNVAAANARTVNGHPMASLSSGGTSMTLATADAGDDEFDTPRQRGWLLDWLINFAAVAGACAFGWWLWQQAPKGATMTLPVTLPA